LLPFSSEPHAYFPVPVVLYRFGTWSVTLKEKHRLRMLENRVLKRIFEQRTDEVRGSWRKLNNKELHKLYSLPSIIRMVKSRKMR
jgi:hypothetical protein